jgi:hypothetical protein
MLEISMTFFRLCWLLHQSIWQDARWDLNPTSLPQLKMSLFVLDMVLTPENCLLNYSLTVELLGR